jgi:hypothetical protein
LRLAFAIGVAASTSTVNRRPSGVKTFLAAARDGLNLAEIECARKTPL